VPKPDRYDDDSNPFGLPEKRGLHFYLGGFARSRSKQPRPKSGAKGWPWWLVLGLVMMGLAILRTWFGS
jgi:LPXTG-motif cell wall-anchored protein